MTSAVNCDDVNGLLGAFVDDELPAHERAMVGAHVQSCPRCAAEVEACRALSLRVRTFGRHTTPDGLASRIMAAIDRQPDATAQTRPWHAARLGRLATHGIAAAVGALAVSLWLRALPPGESANQEREAVALHVRGLMQDQFRSVQSGDPHGVRPWFAGKVGFAPPVADLAESGFPLQGGRVDELAGRPVAALLYGRRQHRITLLVAPHEPAARVAGEAMARERGFNIVSWQDAAFSYHAVSDLNAGELNAFATLVRARAPGQARAPRG